MGKLNMTTKDPASDRMTDPEWISAEKKRFQNETEKRAVMHNSELLKVMIRHFKGFLSALEEYYDDVKRRENTAGIATEPYSKPIKVAPDGL